MIMLIELAHKSVPANLHSERQSVVCMSSKGDTYQIDKVRHLIERREESVMLSARYMRYTAPPSLVYGRPPNSSPQ